MLSNHPIQNAQFANLNHELSVQRALYNEAISRDETLSVKKEIRLKIKELEQKLRELNQNRNS